jgi:predicted acylesterase/phospholipase RssA/uncharacterized Zn-finger protein
MPDAAVPYFHNQPGVAVVGVRAKQLKCIGAVPPFDHPHVSLNMGASDEIVCPYCSTLYRHDALLHTDEAHPPECRWDAGVAPRQPPPRAHIALCLSGGGFRAALFHLGVLKRLHELDLLKYVEIISAVSGGALTAALFKLHARDFDRHARTLVYDWSEFERTLLRVSRAGILQGYMRAGAIWILLSSAALIAFGRSLPLIGALLSALAHRSDIALALAIFAGLAYASLLPLAVRNVRGHRRSISDMRSLNPAVETYTISGPSAFASGDSTWSACLAALLQPLSPKVMRTATMDAELFHHHLLGDLLWPMEVYLGAVELNRGREMIFSSQVLAELGWTGTAALWEGQPHLGAETTGNAMLLGYPFQTTYEVRALPISEAVAASSAYPPFFPPLAILRERDKALVGTFVDGGVLDNAALNTPIEMLIHQRENMRYRDVATTQGPVRFADKISHMLIANVGAPPEHASRAFWSPWRSLRRSVDVMFNDQETNAAMKRVLAGSVSDITIKSIASTVTFPDEEAFRDPRIVHLASRIRTHFDSFDAIETAVLAYLGYRWTDEAMDRAAEPRPPLRSFRDIAGEVTGDTSIGTLSSEQLMAHLRCSHRRLGWLRRLCRAWGTLARRAT